MRHDSPPASDRSDGRRSRGRPLDAELAAALASAASRAPRPDDRPAAAFAAILARLDDAAARRRPPARDNDEAVAALAQALGDLRSRLDDVENRARAASDRTAAADADILAALADHLAALQQKLAADGARQLAAFGEALLAVRRKVEFVERRLDGERAADAAALAEIAGQLDAALTRPDPTPVLAAVERSMDELLATGRGAERELARLTALVTEADRGGLAAAVDALSERLAASHAALPLGLETILDRLAEAVEQVGRSADMAPIEFTLRSIEARLEDAAMPLTADALERRLESLRTDLARDLAPARDGALRDDMAAIAARATKAALSEAPIDAVEAMRQGFSELRALQASGERRTHAALKAIQAALDTLAARPDSRSDAVDGAAADRLQAAVVRLHKAAVQPAAETGPRHAPNASFAARPSDEPGSVRSSFIAAARRATQTANGEAPAAGALDAPSGREHVPSLIDRLRQTFDAHRR